VGANEALTEIWRHGVVALFVSKGLLNPDFARKLLGWRHSGFSIDYANWNPSTPRRTIQA
jgi:hypothetical protein